MTKINTIINGFVDLNLELDENSSTRIVDENIIESDLGIINIDLNDQIITTLSTRSIVTENNRIELSSPKEKILQNIGINDIESVNLMSLQGSRLYGVNKISSDWDLTLVTTSINSYDFRETVINGEEYDFHIYSPNKFQEKLNNHNMRELEVLFHPDKFRIIEKFEYFVDLDKEKLVQTVKKESDELWKRGEEILNEDKFDSYRALKSIWHSFRFLIFAKQILETGSINNFSEANFLYEPIVKSKQKDFSYFDTNFRALRDSLKDELDNYIVE